MESHSSAIVATCSYTSTSLFNGLKRVIMMKGIYHDYTQINCQSMICSVTLVAPSRFRK